MIGLKAPQEVIDRYMKRLDFELFDVHIPAWRVVMLLSPADMYFRETHQGKKIYMKFAGFKTPAVADILRLLKIKKAGRVLQQIRLIENGAITNG